MPITTFQKVTLASCIVLCISLFLPKMMLYGVKKELMKKTGKGIIHHPVSPDVPSHFPDLSCCDVDSCRLPTFTDVPKIREDCPHHSFITSTGPGYYPTGLPRKQPLGGLEPWEAETDYTETLSSEVAKAQAKESMWGNKKSNHFGQIVPIYGVGILFYILHIFFKLTRQDKKAKPSARCRITNSESLAQHISEEELARLEARLSHAEMLMNRVMSSSSTRTESVKSKSSSRRKSQSSLLRRLRRFGRSLQEDQREGVTPEMEAEEVPYGLDWEGYPEETFPQYDEPCGPRKYDTIIVEAPPPDLRSAEELAEQMDKEDEEIERELGVIEEGDEDMEENEEKTEEEEEEDDDEEDEEEEEEEEEEETEDDEMFKFKDTEEEEEEEEEVGEETPCLSHSERVEERSCQKQSGGLGRFLGLTSGDPPECRRRRITFSEHKDIFRYPREGTIDEEDEEEEEEEADEGEEEEDDDDDDDDSEDDDDEEEEGVEAACRVPSAVREGVVEVDPLMEAESLKFSTEASSEDESERMEPEEEGGKDKNEEEEEDDSDDDYDDDDDDEEDEEDGQEVGLEEFLSTYRPAINTRLSQARVDLPPTSGQLRMRNKGKEKE